MSNQRQEQVFTSLNRIFPLFWTTIAVANDYGTVYRLLFSVRRMPAKSSLLNALAARDAAIVSDIAGTTRDVIEVHLDLGGWPVTLADTAGLRDAGDLVEREGRETRFGRAVDADLCLVLFDATALPDQASRKLLDRSNAVAVVTKTDLKGGLDPNDLGLDALLVSAKTGDGLPQLLSHLEEAAVDLNG